MPVSLNQFRAISPEIKMYSLWLLLYSLFSLLGQFGSKISVDLSFLLGSGWWVPLSTLTIIPLVDVSRSFAQHYSEKSRLTVRQAFSLMLFCPFIISLVFAFMGSLPPNITLAAFVAVNLGGLMDLLVFRLARRISAKPYVRMWFSNLAATLTGSTAFYWIAYTDVLDRFLWVLGVNYQNTLIMDNLLKGWIVHNLVIWSSSIVIALLLGKLLERIER